MIQNSNLLSTLAHHSLQVIFDPNRGLEKRAWEVYKANSKKESTKICVTGDDSNEAIYSFRIKLKKMQWQYVNRS